MQVGIIIINMLVYTCVVKACTCNVSICCVMHAGLCVVFSCSCVCVTALFACVSLMSVHAHALHVCLFIRCVCSVHVQGLCCVVSVSTRVCICKYDVHISVEHVYVVYGGHVCKCGVFVYTSVMYVMYFGVG